MIGWNDFEFYCSANSAKRCSMFGKSLKNGFKQIANKTAKINIMVSATKLLSQVIKIWMFAIYSFRKKVIFNISRNFIKRGIF